MPTARFAGANGSVRDMRERDRLERELRESEDRYRNLASSSPDLVFATDAEGRYTFLSDGRRTMLGWDRDAAVGRHFTEYVAPGWEAEAAASYEAVIADPTTVHSAPHRLPRWATARRSSSRSTSLGKVEDGVLVGINGVARDISERLRLERELSQSEERYRFLIENSPDIVFSTDAEGKFTFLSDAIERMLGTRAADAIGQHFSILVDQSTLPLAGNRWAELVANPGHETQADLFLKTRDGASVPVDVRAIGIVEDGRFAGIQGATRDVSDQVRLERELRRQAGELAAGEERAHLARELHDSVTQALFSMTLVSRSVEMLLDRDTDAARGQLGQLRELQREALAEMRALIFELRPGNLEQDGLVRALKTHTAALQGRIGLPIVVESTLDERLPLADRGGPLPDRPGSAPQRRQARRRRAQVRLERRAGSAAASGCASRTTARASIRRASRTAISGSPGCGPGPTGSAAAFAVHERGRRGHDHRGRSCPDAARRSRPRRGAAADAASEAASIRDG